MFLRFGISLKIARQFFDQLAVVGWSYVFSHAWAPVTFLASSSDWFIWLSERFVIRQSIYFVSGLTCVTSQIWPFPFRKEVILHKPAKRREFPSTLDPHVELFYGDRCLYFQLSPQVRESKTVLDSGFLAVYPGFWILCQWNFLSVFQSLVVFRIPWAISRIPQAKFPGLWIAQAKFPGVKIPQVKFPGIWDPNSLTWGHNFVSPSNFPQFCCCAKKNFFCYLFLNKITFIFLNLSDFRSV